MKRFLRISLILLSMAAWQSSQAQTYCEYLFGFAWCSSSWAIDDITIGTFSEQNSSCNNGAYSKNLTSTVTLVKGAPVSFSLSSGGTAVQWAIWVDCNADGDFTDASDYFIATTSATTTFTGNIIIPSTATATQTRIRIASRDQSLGVIQSDACNFGYQAETQDFACLLNAGVSSCSIPTNLTATTGVSTANLSWDSTGTQYNIEYGLEGFTLGNGSTASSSTHSAVISNLLANTSYDYYVQTDCSASSGDSSSFNGPHTFITQCTEITSFPFVEGFEDSLVWYPSSGYSYDDTISNCWKRIPDFYTYNEMWLCHTGPTSSNNTGPDAGYGGSGNYMYIEPNGSIGDEAFFTSPVFNTSSLTSPYLSFYYHMYGSEMGSLYIEVSTNGGASWTTIDSLIGEQQISSSAAFLERGLDVTTYKSSSFQFRFRSVHTAGYTYGDMAIDQVSLGEAPSCPKPGAVTLSNFTGSSVDVNWASNASTFYLEIGTQGFTQGTGNIDTVTSTNHTFNNLDGDTYYDVYIQSDCSSGGNGYSPWAGPYTFRTYIRPEWFEDFNTDGFLPNIRWSKTQGVIGNPTVLSATYSQWYEDGWLNNGYDGAVRCYISYYSTAQEWFMTEKIDLGTGNNWEIYFDAAITTTGTSSAGALEADDVMKVVVSTDGGLTWYDNNTVLSITQANNLSNSAQTFTASLAGYSGVVKIGFYMESTVANTIGLDFFVDNIGIRTPAVCPAPTGINAWNIGPNSLTLGWSGPTNATGYSIEYGPKGFGQGTGTFINGITVDSAVVANLQPTTQYDFYVISICGTDSLSGGPLTVYTGCPAVISTPYSENFDILENGLAPLGGKWKNCWETSNPTSNYYNWRVNSTSYSGTGPASDHTTGSGKFIYADGGYNGIDAFLVNGPFDLSQLTTPTLTFFYHMYGADMGDLHVDISTDRTNWQEAVYSIYGQQQNASTDPWVEANIPLSQYVNDTIYIRFRAIRGPGYNSDIAIDDVSIDEGTGCISPAGLTAINKTSTTVDLSWGSYESKHTIEWGTSGFIQGTGQGTVINNISGTTYGLSNLTPNTPYDFYVKDTCTLNTWVGPATFFTECTGPLSGTYTIGGTAGPTNFATMASAINSLSNCGISGSVTFNLMGVNDTGSYTFGNIPGISALHTVTFNGNGNDEIYATPWANYTFEFDGASYIKLKNITILNTLGNSAIWFHNGAHDIGIENCVVYGQSGTNPDYGSAAISASFVNTNSSTEGQNAFNITLDGNTIYNGYRSLSFYGDDGNPTHGLVITNNTFKLPYSYGVFAYGVDSVTVTGNSMNSISSQYSGYGVYFSNINEFNISGNYFNFEGDLIYLYQCNVNTVSANSTIANNMLMSAGSYGRGLYISNSNHINIYHNSISSIGYGCYISGTTSDYFDVRNNIFESYLYEALYQNSNGTNFIFDYNVYNALGNNFVYVNGSYANLSAWQTATPSQNVHSLEADPGFASADDLHIISVVPNDVGDNTVGISVDFDGDTRPASGSTFVDIGADEFTPKNVDLAVIRVLAPLQGCGDSSMAVTLLIKNMGIDTVTSAPISVNVTGDINATLSTTYTGSLSQLSYDTVTVGTINGYSGATSFKVTGFTTLANDEDSSNDTATSGDIFLIPHNPSFYAPDTVCNNPADSAALAAVPFMGVTYGWYSSAVATSPVAQGDSFTFSMAGQKEWYLGYIDGLTDSLKSQNFNALYGGNGGLMFDLTAKTNLFIDSLALHARTNAGSNEALIIRYIPNASYTDHSNKPADWIVHDSIVYAGTQGNQRVPITLTTPLHIPVGQTYAVYFDFNCYWETGSSLSTTVNSDMMTYQGGIGFYSGSFNLETNNRVLDGIIFSHSEACSQTRIPVEINIYSDTAIASFTTAVSQPNKVDVDASASQGDVIEWNFGDGTTATGATYAHTYVNGGQYTITCTVTDTVCNTVDTATFIVNMTIGIDENDLARSLEIYPNPSSGIYNVSFDLTLREDVSMEVIDGLGRVLYAHSFNKTMHVANHVVDLSKQPNGIYFVRLTAGNTTAVKKITKM